MSGINLNKKVIAVPRLAKYNEHVNDHQLQIVETFNNKGYIKGITDVSMLPNAIKEINDFNPKKYTSNTNNIIEIISNYINKN